jgi:hypothetical protein
MTERLVVAICGAISTLGLIVMIAYLVGRAAEALPKLTVVEFEKLQGDQAIVTLSDGRKFRGSCTVWHSWPMGKRASTSIELICSDEWTRQMWELEK